MGPKHAPPFEFRSGQYLDYLEKTLALCLDQKNLKTWKKLVKKIKRGKLGQWLYTNNFKLYTNVTKPLNGRHSG